MMDDWLFEKTQKLLAVSK